MKKRVGQREDQQFLVGLGAEQSGQSHLHKKVRFQRRHQYSEINTWGESIPERGYSLSKGLEIEIHLFADFLTCS